MDGYDSEFSSLVQNVILTHFVVASVEILTFSSNQGCYDTTFSLSIPKVCEPRMHVTRSPHGKASVYPVRSKTQEGLNK